MDESREYGPWIDHDGKGYPSGVLRKMEAQGWKGILRRHLGPGRKETPFEQANRPEIDTSNPGWTWKRKYVSFGHWVASDPSYAPIVRYRVFRDKPPAESAQVEALREIVSNPPRELISDEAGS